MNQEKLTALLENEEFVDALSQAETIEGAQKLFADNDVTISIDELKALCAKAKQESGEELSDEELELVAGGIAPIIIAPIIIAAPILIKLFNSQR
ncbi:MAG: class IIb bacteriocin, lactobin A/cerein 7B family [Defluviitaleaceae bacterium]|nr:class IIb bacteriocin, lactobin A/cerein 7B family [Defluviitaleaceae bacterium]